MEHASSWAKRPATSLTPPTACGGDFTAEGFGEIILPALWERRTFDEKAAGSPVLSQMWAFQDNQAMTYSSGVPALTCRHTGLAHGGAGAALTGGPAATATSGSTVGGYPVTQGALAATGNYTIGTCNGGTLAPSAAPHLAGTATSHFGGNEPAKFTNVGAERVPYAKLGALADQVLQARQRQALLCLHAERGVLVLVYRPEVAVAVQVYEGVGVPVGLEAVLAGLRDGGHDRHEAGAPQLPLRQERLGMAMRLGAVPSASP